MNIIADNHNECYTNAQREVNESNGTSTEANECSGTVASIPLKVNDSYGAHMSMETNGTAADIPLEVNESSDTNVHLKANECYGTAPDIPLEVNEENYGTDVQLKANECSGTAPDISLKVNESYGNNKWPWKTTNVTAAQILVSNQLQFHYSLTSVMAMLQLKMLMLYS